MTKLSRRRFVHFAAAAAGLSTIESAAWAQTYPMRPVRIVVGFAAGGGVDITARLMGQWLSGRLGRPFIIENRPGAAGNIAAEAVVRAAPDGYTLLLVNGTDAINAMIYQKLNFDLTRDIAPVGAVMRVPLLMVVNQSSPVRTVPEFIAYAKANPGRINFASGGAGGPDHMSGELFKMMTGTNMTHVPYRGQSPALTDLIGGQVELMFSSFPAAIEYIRADKLRALAVTTTTRFEGAPDIPTVGEIVTGFEASQWYGIGAPMNTPAAIVDKLNEEINMTLADPTKKAQLADLGGTVLPGSPGKFGKFVADEAEKWSKVAKFAGIKLE
jgi:tripartite-type tricarboxylate transporter receptor subunit TctC